MTIAKTIKINEANRTIRILNINSISVTFYSSHRSEISLTIVAILD